MPPYNTTESVFQNNSNDRSDSSQVTVNKVIYCPSTDVTYKGHILASGATTLRHDEGGTSPLPSRKSKPNKVHYVKHGKGLLHNHSAGITLEGYFQNDHVVGHALQTMYDPCGRVVAQYEGSFLLEDEQDHYIRHGKGKYTWQNTNDVYSGDFYMGVMQGMGTFIWGTGDRYEGPFKNGLMHGPKGKKYSQSSGDVFEGSFRKGRMHGWGTKVFGNGDVFCGMYSRDVRQGFGSYSWNTGDTYNGTWVGGTISGRGVKSLVVTSQRRNSFTLDDVADATDRALAQGDTYEYYIGDWIHGVAQGSGVKHYACGDVHFGCYCNGNRHGYGIYTWANGDVYQGSFLNGSCSGYGVKVTAIGDVYDGEWFEDKANGYGVKTFANGDVHMGQYENDERHGLGLMTWANGDQYEGDFEGGELSGFGIYKWNDSMSYCGQWLKGKKCGPGYLKHRMANSRADVAYFEFWVKGVRVVQEQVHISLEHLPAISDLRNKKQCLDEILNHHLNGH